MFEIFKLFDKLSSETTHSILFSNFLLNKRSLFRVENSHVIDEKSIKIVLFKSSRSNFRRVKNASSNDLKIRRNIQKDEESEKEKKCRRLFDDDELIVQFVDDDEHLIFEIKEERQRELFARELMTTIRMKRRNMKREFRNKTSKRLYEIGDSEINEGV